MLFHTKLCHVCKKRQRKKYLSIQPGVSFIFSSQRLNQLSVRHQDIKSSEQGFKRRKVIRAVKKGIVDKEVLNEPKDAYIAGGYLERFTFYCLDFFLYGKHDISKSFYRNYMISFFKCSSNY